MKGIILSFILTGDKGRIYVWNVGPGDKIFPEAECRGQQVVWKFKLSYAALITSQ